MNHFEHIWPLPLEINWVLLLLLPYHMQKTNFITPLVLEIKLTHYLLPIWACSGMPEHTHWKQPTNTYTARKTIFSFSKWFEKMVFRKKSHWNMIFLVLSGKTIFLFPESMILFFRQKRKDDLSQKNTWKNDIFLKCCEKMVFPKNSRLNMIFFVISGNTVFLFSRKHDIFSLGGKWKKIIFIKKRVEIWYFLYICVGVTGVTLPSWEKKQRCPEKIHLRVTSPASPKKMIFILDLS